MPAIFTQTFLKPGRYHVGGGKYRTITAGDIQRYVEGTRALLAAGNHVPVLFEHAPPGSDEGGPQQFSADHDERARRVRNGAGWLTGVAIGSDGAATATYEITDATAAQKLADKSIKFVSPELREQYVDGRGRVFDGIIAHMALTHKPRATDQGEFRPVDGGAVPAMQFSLEDWRPLKAPSKKKKASAATQFADDDDDDEKKNPFGRDGDGDGEAGEGASDDDSNAGGDSAPVVAPAEEANPDAPKEGNPDQQQQFEAVVAHLNKLGAVLPNTISIDDPWALILTALKTLDAAKTKAEMEAESSGADEGGESLHEEHPPVMQYSIGDIEADRIPNKLLAKVVKSYAADIDRRIAAQLPIIRERLKKYRQAVQFSVDGETMPCLTLGEVLDFVEEVAPRRMMLANDPASAEQFSAPEHPDGDAFYAPLESINGHVTPQQAKAHVDALAAKYPSIFR